MSSTIDKTIPPLKHPSLSAKTEGKAEALIKRLNLQPHVEGGYFVETDRDPVRIFWPSTLVQQKNTSRNASTTIYYFLDPQSPFGALHRNRGRTVHTLHSGRGRYVIIHADEAAAPSNSAGYGEEKVSERAKWIRKASIETFVVGHDVAKGERLQWIVDGGKYKCSFLLADENSGSTSDGLLISETVVPGFEYEDHDFMLPERLQALVTAEQQEELSWMLKKE